MRPSLGTVVGAGTGIAGSNSMIVLGEGERGLSLDEQRRELGLGLAVITDNVEREPAALGVDGLLHRKFGKFRGRHLSVSISAVG